MRHARTTAPAHNFSALPPSRVQRFIIYRNKYYKVWGLVYEVLGLGREASHGVVKSGAAARPTRSLPTHAKPKSSNTGSKKTNKLPTQLWVSGCPYIMKQATINFLPNYGLIDKNRRKKEDKHIKNRSKNKNNMKMDKSEEPKKTKKRPQSQATIFQA